MNKLIRPIERRAEYRRERRYEDGILWANRPFSVGYEMEQPGHDEFPAISREAWNSFNYIRDLSGPWEINLPQGGGVSYPKAILAEFDSFVQLANGPWEWQIETESGDGCGCHVHAAPLLANYPNLSPSLQKILLWNTLMEVSPFLAPFWSWNWTRPPFRGQNNPRRNVEYWAKPCWQRFSPEHSSSTWDDIEDFWNSGTQGNYPAVRLNSAEGQKPVTIELRMSETHPAVAMTGMTILGQIVGRVYDREASPKIKGVFDRNNRLVFSREDFLRQAYSAAGLYNYQRGLADNMNFPHNQNYYIVFENGREVPGIGGRVRSMRDLFLRIISEYCRDTGSYKDRIAKLANHHFRYGHMESTPRQNNDKIFMSYKISKGGFRWEYGPEVL